MTEGFDTLCIIGPTTIIKGIKERTACECMSNLILKAGSCAALEAFELMFSI